MLCWKSTNYAGTVEFCRNMLMLSGDNFAELWGMMFVTGRQGPPLAVRIRKAIVIK